ncbi:Protein of unknown function [Pyronema omphalodes CBS 100304]|uniref:Uncharacterized protein n=1 Tax=Pyronema omphalodes (strain CBS 100304) TaxID=1076935 RepID=U4L0K8_PYROM|nr:Protein of unknown function [Pyronema omphalodes CBS 100304]
MKHRNDERLET